MKEEGFKFDVAYTSVLKRAIKTLNNALETMGDLWVPTHKSWRLNEKSYGIYKGLIRLKRLQNTVKTKYFCGGRSYDVQPPLLEKSDERQFFTRPPLQQLN